MAETAESVAAYLAGFPEDVRARLELVRTTILRVIPDAEEQIKYGMPALVYASPHAVYFAGWKNHIAVYPVYRSDDPIEADLAPYRDAKDTLKFPHAAPIPYDLIERAVRLVTARWRTD
jgi:uncharacterized protein YdhG (YjbR/CyaY superfamily)